MSLQNNLSGLTTNQTPPLLGAFPELPQIGGSPAHNRKSSSFSSSGPRTAWWWRRPAACWTCSRALVCSTRPAAAPASTPPIRPPLPESSTRPCCHPPVCVSALGVSAIGVTENDCQRGIHSPYPAPNVALGGPSQARVPQAPDACHSAFNRVLPEGTEGEPSGRSATRPSPAVPPYVVAESAAMFRSLPPARLRPESRGHSTPSDRSRPKPFVRCRRPEAGSLPLPRARRNRLEND
jgi:hypothetical protein